MTTFAGAPAGIRSAAHPQAVITRADFDPSYGCAVLYVRGYLDESTAPLFRERLYDAIDRGARDIILDFSAVEGMGSVGMGALVCGVRRFGSDRGRIAVAGCPPLLEGSLRMAGVRDLFPCYPTVDAARVALFRSIAQVFEPTRENCAQLRHWLRGVVSDLDLSSAETDAVEAAVSEAFSNAVQHASPRKESQVTVRVFLGSSLVVEVQDQGPGFEARQYFAVDPDALPLGARGLGIYVMRHLMDDVEFVAGASGTTESPAGTTVRLVKRLKAPSDRAASNARRPRG